MYIFADWMAISLLLIDCRGFKNYRYKNKTSVNSVTRDEPTKSTVKQEPRY